MFFIYIYNILNILLLPLYILVILIRILRKKDNCTSLLQRLGIINTVRSPGKMIWIHAASVGESMVAITIINSLEKKYKNYNFVVTTGTISSATLIKKYLFKNTTHQYAPIDNIIATQSFLNHWKPDLGMFIESELWPCLINAASKKTNLILINARLSDKSYKRWQKNKWLFKLIINNFKAVMVQSKTDLHKYMDLGCINPVDLGNLKFTNKEMEINQKDLLSLQKLLIGKKVLVAASTHQEDEEATLEIIVNFKKNNINNYYPIIILRHPERRDELIKLCKSLGLKYSLRSESMLQSLDNDLYIVDTFGEVGLFYSIADIVFVGGSFKRGGHNLVEPAYFNNIIILGPDMSNHQNIADDMVKNKAAIQVQSSEELRKKIDFFLNSSGEKEAIMYKKNALQFVRDRKEIVSKYLEYIEKFLND